MSVTRRAPRASLTALSLLQREIGQLFERLGEIEHVERPGTGEWSPSLDVYESRGSLVITAEVPGFGPDSLRVIGREREIVLTGERRERKPPGVCGFLCVERPQGRFARTVAFDVAVDLKQARATLQDGVLTLTLPRLRDRRGREVEIPVERGEGDG
ncbi:MAG TPA: Hsp20/alpha crystallin family protein [Vicinamibacteria bacterium]|jgi:HSP20 family protein|nr:Hsp20/alpha crystallin family protein [Vicinamibacteria bacterium]